MEILSLGEKIKRRRKQLNMTLKDLARDRITPGQISLVESGRSNPSVDLLEYLASTLNTTVEYLMESEESQAEKISIYYENIGESCILNGNYEKGKKYIENALYYSEKYNLEYRKAKIFFIIAESYMFKRDFPMAQKFFLSSNVIFVKNNNYEDIIKTFIKLADIAIKIKAYNSAISYLKQSEMVYNDKQIIDDFLIGEIHYNMSRTYFDIENLELSLKYAYMAKEKFEQIYNDNYYARTLLAIAEDYNKKDDILNALKYSKKTLQIYKKIEHNRNIVSIERNLGRIFYELDQLDESFKHYEISKNISIQNRIGCTNDTLIDICKNYLKLKNTKKCEKILFDIENSLSEKDVDRRIQCQLIRYTMLNIDESFGDAESVLRNTCIFAKENGRLAKAGELAMRLGKYFMDKKNEQQANYYLNEGIELFRQAEESKTNK